jgi:U3 small nucleolar RNA-associated protein 14
VDLDEDEDMDQGSKSDDANDNDEEEEEEEGDDDEFIDLLDVLDGKGEIDIGSDTEDTPKPPSQPPRETEEDFSADEDHRNRNSDGEDDSEGSSGSDLASEDEKMEVEFSGDEDDVSPEALEELQNFVSKLDPTSSKKRKALGDGDSSVGADTRARKRRLVKERTEAGAEDEFHARAAGL